MADTTEGRPVETVFVTGFPAFLARRMVKKSLEADARAQVVMLCKDVLAADAEAFRGSLAPSRRRRLEVLTGEVDRLDLGLSGEEIRRLTATVTIVHHLAARTDLSSSRDALLRVNVEGTRAMIDLADSAPRLRRLVHWSTVSVSGDRKGVVLEEELEAGQGFRNVVEETRHEAERLARAAMARLPVTVLRPGVVVGDSRTGEIDRFDGPTYLIRLIVASPVNVRVPLPGRGTAPLHLVPVDFVVDAAHQLARVERARGRTFHLVDPHPLSARHVYELVAQRANRRPPRSAMPAAVARALLMAPGLERLTRAPRAFVESLDHHVFYNCRGASDFLRGTSIACPPLDSYVDSLIAFVRQAHETRAERAAEEASDPLD